MRPRSRGFAAAALLALPVAGPAAVASVASEGSEDVRAEVALTFRDDRIDESSGLVVRRRTVLTVNDSGDGPYLYEVDRRTGETSGVTVFAAEDPVDVEALAPGRGGTVWVGDLGDNARARSTITLHRVRPVPGGGTGASVSFGLRYPDGPHDAETLLVHPRTGRVLVVTKRLLVGGTVYVAPARLAAGEVHRLRRVAAVPGTVTDGAFLPDGRHVVLRTYGAAAVYTYPAWEQVAAFELPTQEQGEAAAVGPDGRLYLSTEGAGSEVLVVDLPAPATPPTSVSPSPEGTPAPVVDADEPADGEEPTGEEEPADAGTGDWFVLGYATAVGVGVVVVGLLVRAARRRGRRRP